MISENQEKLMKTKLEYLKKNFDSMAILGVFTKVTLDNFIEPSIDDQMVIQAFRRYKTDFSDASLEEIGEYLGGMKENQIEGVVNNVKGILHEMEFVRMENEDGDSVTAALYPETNHPGYDVVMYDEDTSQAWQIQLKATEDSSEVNEWIEEHPDGVILVNEELAEELDLPSSGISEKGLEVRVEDVVDKLKDVAEDNSVWDYFPVLTTVSISIIIWELYKRYKAGKITAERFKWMAAKVTGFKMAKIALIMFLLTIPVVNVITGAALVFHLIKSGQKLLDA
jgi:hypothetical protein|tara:strand:- start:3680 stop:4525 length:846 start_codon:yes stop_codon:yes gene_type:complete